MEQPTLTPEQLAADILRAGELTDEDLQKLTDGLKELYKTIFFKYKTDYDFEVGRILLYAIEKAITSQTRFAQNEAIKDKRTIGSALFAMKVDKVAIKEYLNKESNYACNFLKANGVAAYKKLFDEYESVIKKIEGSSFFHLSGFYFEASYFHDLFVNFIEDLNRKNDINELKFRFELETRNSAIEQNKIPTMKSKLDFTKDKLRAILLELANMNGYERPSTYLDELLNEVKQFNDSDFEFNFFLNIHHICEENAGKFWSEGHRNDITAWLNKSPFPANKSSVGEKIIDGLPEIIRTPLFETTWESLPPQQTEDEIKVLSENKFNPGIKSVEELKDFFTKELKHFANEVTINEFLYSAFQLCQIPQQKYSFENLNYKKKKIMNVFNNFYNSCGKIQSDATKYAELLGNYFIGFETENVRTNWTK
jgi:hypothetical protein